MSKKLEYPKPVIYLAGPMTGIKHFNADEFIRVGDKLKSMGYEVLNPADNDIQNGFDPFKWDGTEPPEVTGFDLKGAMEWDLAAVRRADAVFVLPFPSFNWTSAGVTAELKEAKAHKVPVYRLTEVELAQILHHDSYETDFPVDRNAFPAVKTIPFGKQAPIDLLEVPPIQNVPGLVENIIQPSTQRDDQQDAQAKLVTDHADIQQTFLPKYNRFTDETRTTSSTGGEKGVKDARYDLIPVQALEQLAIHYGVGARKYDDNQWRKGYEWSKSYAALQRHATQFWNGEDFDEETGSNHMAAVAWHAFTLLTFFYEHPDFDDRYKGQA